MSINARAIKRAVVTPGTIGLFIVSTVTGVMLLLHWQGGLVRFSHEWLSLVFSGIAVWHLVRNWGAFRQYLTNRLAVGVLVATLVASAGVTAVTGSTDSVSPGAVFHALDRAPLKVVAPAFSLSAEDGVARLAAAGIEAGPDDTLADIGARNGTTGAAIASRLAQGGAAEQ